MTPEAATTSAVHTPAAIIAVPLEADGRSGSSHELGDPPVARRPGGAT